MIRKVLKFCAFFGGTQVPKPNNYTEIHSYMQEREDLINESQRQSIGGHLRLNQDELLVNEILMKYKNQEIERGYKNPEKFLAEMHFFQARKGIQESCVFKIIQRMPKGASLHAHDISMVSDEYVFNNITFRENLYAKEHENGKIDLKFFKDHPGEPWEPISSIRERDKTFDDKLFQQLTLFRDGEEHLYPTVNSDWSAFEQIFCTVLPMLTYKPVFRDYFYQALKELYEDNVRYLEFRGILPELYDLEGNTYGPEDVVQLYYETSKQFLDDYPDFWGVKFIFGPAKSESISEMEDYLKFVKKMQEKYTDGFFAGFDLVGQEDLGPPLKDFIPGLLELKKITKFFFHAGETKWNGLPSDLNLFDAVLLESSRIAHFFAALKHPEILRIVKERNIALEMCPISNQVLGLVRSLSNHPGTFLIANNYPVVIGSDDPGLWGAKGISYDWYMMFMAMASKKSDLKLLKQLAINSIIYSSMDEDEKKEAMIKWEHEWRTFLKDVLKGNFGCSRCRSKAKA